MTLNSVNKPGALDPNLRGVWFPMQDGAKTIRVFVSDEALMHIEYPLSTSDAWELFNKHRSRLERIADDKYGKRELENDGTIHIRQVDVLESA